MKTKIISLILLLAAGVILFSGCGKKSNNSTNPTSNNNGAPVAAASVTIENFAFSPAAVKLLPGGKVTWTNKDTSPHTATDIGGTFDSGNLNTDQTFEFTFSTPGTYTYHCTIHSMMANATIIVGN